MDMDIEKTGEDRAPCQVNHRIASGGRRCIARSTPEEPFSFNGDSGAFDGWSSCTLDKPAVGKKCTHESIPFSEIDVTQWNPCQRILGADATDKSGFRL
jgi:hypothetical protein